MPRPPRRHPGQGMACLLVVLASLVSLARNVGAAGFQVNEQSARGLGSAFAGEAAAAEDASTIFFNPAGIPSAGATTATAGRWRSCRPCSSPTNC